jgi:integrase
MKATSHAESPNPVKRTVSRGRLPNAHYRQREYLTEREVERLMKAAGDNRHGHRDATVVLLTYRHGLRASELCALRWEQVDLTHGLLHVARAKNGMPSVHPRQRAAGFTPIAARAGARALRVHERARGTHEPSRLPPHAGKAR